MVDGKTNPGKSRWFALLGPAFVASVAYLDPGNVAVNISAGAHYGYLLVWVLVLSNAIAVYVQYQSAKLGIVTGQSLPEILGERLSPWPRRAYWLQAELVIAATEIAEVIGGAIALNLLFGLPLALGGFIVGVVSILILSIHSRHGQRTFEVVIVGFLAVIAIGFLAGLFVSPVNWSAAASGLVPRFQDAQTVLLAAGMLGATVMPHAIYVHSTLARDRHGKAIDQSQLRRLMRATRLDVVGALAIAGSVNIAMLLLAAASLMGSENTDTIEGAFDAIQVNLGPAIAVIFAIGLLASGFASTAVGSHAGSAIMDGLLTIRIPVLLRRMATLIPAIVILAIGIDPTQALVLSQVFLSLGIPFALVPLLRFTSNEQVMLGHHDKTWVRVLGYLVATLVISLNLALLFLTFL